MSKCNKKNKLHLFPGKKKKKSYSTNAGGTVSIISLQIISPGQIDSQPV